MKINSLRISHRLALGFGILLVLNMLAVVISYRQLNSLEIELRYLLSLTHQSELADTWRAKTELNSNRVIAMAKSGKNPAVVAHFSPRIDATSAEISATQSNLEKLTDSAQAKTILDNIADKRKSYVSLRKKILAAINAADEGAQREAALAEVDTKMLPAVTVYDKAIKDMVEYQRTRVDSRIKANSDQVQFTKNLLLVLTAAVLALGITASWFIARSVIMPLRNLVRETAAIGQGDLSRCIVVEGKDEVGELQDGLVRMQQSLRTLLQSIQESSESISTASSKIASGNTDLSSRTEQTASQLQQTSSTTESVTGTVAHTAESALAANQLAMSASNEAQRGGTVVAQVVATMHEISDSSKKIGDIIGVIDGIAFQTNILALNAAVEAARAGEQGRGFAVVASEVRSLAQRSAGAAREIKTLISGNVERVTAGNHLVNNAGDAIRDVIVSTKTVSDIIRDIASSAGKQTSGLAQINRSVSDLDHMTQKNATLVEASAAAASSLKDQANTLVGLTRGFKLA